jgi:hypothetical protein
MTADTQQWLAPMFKALLATSEGGAAFARFMEAAVLQARTHSARGPAIDWVIVGQLIRAELGWSDYPASPRHTSDCHDRPYTGETTVA